MHVKKKEAVDVRAAACGDKDSEPSMDVRMQRQAEELLRVHSTCRQEVLVHPWTYVHKKRGRQAHAKHTGYPLDQICLTHQFFDRLLEQFVHVFQAQFLLDLGGGVRLRGRRGGDAREGPRRGAAAELCVSAVEEKAET